MAALVQSLTQFYNFFQKNPSKSPKTPFFAFPPSSQHQYFDPLEGRNRQSEQNVIGLLMLLIVILKTIITRYQSFVVKSVTSYYSL